MGSYSYYTQTVANFRRRSELRNRRRLAWLCTGFTRPSARGIRHEQHCFPGLKVGPFSSFANIGYYQNRVNPSTNVIFTLGRHTIVAGGGYSYTQLNITNNRTGIAQVKTKNFETFLEDEVNSSNVLETIKWTEQR